MGGWIKIGSRLVGEWWSLHTHTCYSKLDALPAVSQVVAKSAQMGYPALGISDHGSLAGAVQFYKACNEHGIAPCPGIEAYLLDPEADLAEKKATRYHIGVYALNHRGYQGLVRLNNLSHTRPRFSRFPRITLEDLRQFGRDYGNDVFILTGCYFGWAQQTLITKGDQAADGVLRMYAAMFPNTYVELQAHGVVHEDGTTDQQIWTALADSAYFLGLPVVITQDSHYCLTGDAPIWMADMSFKSLGDIKVGDRVMGWRYYPEKLHHKKEWRHATVTHVSRRVAPVVKVTMASGTVIRSTSDHKWATWAHWRYGDRNGWGRGMYAEAHVGMGLVKLIEPTKELSGQERDAALWLGGLYDGEGCKSAITQSMQHNPDVCKRIEEVLDLLSIRYSNVVKHRQGSGCESYNILGGMQAYVDFLNQAKPVRSDWFHYKVLNTVRSRGEDRVVSIEPDGSAEVITLTTTTGNYVAHGYASKNCDQKDKSAHNLLKRMTYGGSDDEFPGETYHVASAEWVSEHYDDKTWKLGLDGLDDIISRLDWREPALDAYQPRIPFVDRAPLARLRRTVSMALRAAHKHHDKRYTDRVSYELSVIEKMADADYFLLVHKFAKLCRDRGVCIEVRGSANGSLVLYLLGVTSVDPIAWGTQFDRFLSPDRIQPPDVDIDIESSEREWAVAELQKLYPSAARIGTHSKLGISFDRETGEERGSVLVTYKAWLLAKAKQEHTDPAKVGWITTIDDVGRFNAADHRDLRRLDKYGTVLKSYGVHAAGVLLPGADLDIDGVVPLALVPSGSGNTVTQFDQDDAEAWGFTKLDILGQATLSVMKLAQQMIGRDDPTDFEWIPYDDPQTMAFIREGRPNNGTFHWEGWTRAKGARMLKPRTTMDCVLAMALFMPGASDIAPGQTRSQADVYLERRFNREARNRVTYLHPIFEQVLKSTYGCVLFQDQVMDIMRRLGMSVASVNKFIKVVKDSGKGSSERNRKRMSEVRGEFDQLCHEHNLDPNAVWAQTAAFAAYGFNKAHATSYGIRSYRSAYLNYHYPHEYLTALLIGWAGTKKEAFYVREARHRGIRVLPASVNTSGMTWRLDTSGRRPVIHRALLSVDKVGPRAAQAIEAKQPYTSIVDLIERTDSRAVSGGKDFLKSGQLTGTLGALQVAGALKELPSGTENHQQQSPNGKATTNGRSAGNDSQPVGRPARRLTKRLAR